MSVASFLHSAAWPGPAAVSNEVHARVLHSSSASLHMCVLCVFIAERLLLELLDGGLALLGRLLRRLGVRLGHRALHLRLVRALEQLAVL